MGSINGDVLLNMVPQSATEEKSRTNPEDEVEKKHEVLHTAEATS